MRKIINKKNVKKLLFDTYKVKIGRENFTLLIETMYERLQERIQELINTLPIKSREKNKGKLKRKGLHPSDFNQNIYVEGKDATIIHHNRLHLLLIKNGEHIRLFKQTIPYFIGFLESVLKERIEEVIQKIPIKKNGNRQYNTIKIEHILDPPSLN
jgi:hypothetical protein